MNDKKHSIYFFIILAFLYMAANFAHPVTPTIFNELNLGDYMFGLALGIMLAINFLFSPFWGKITTYISSRNVLLICNLGYAVGQIFFALARTEFTFILARMFAGIFTGGAFIGVLTYITNTTDDLKKRGTYLIAYATIQTVFSAFGYLIGGLLGVISPYVAIGAQVFTLSACAIAFRVLCIDDKERNLNSIDKNDFAREINPFTAFLDSKKFMNISLTILLTACALQYLGFTAFDQTFNYYIKDIFNFSSAYNGIIKGIMGLISLVANSTICVWLIRHTDLKKSVIFVLLLCSSAMLGAILFRDMIPFIILNAVFFAFNSISIPTMQNLVTDIANTFSKENSNLLIGLYNALRSFGGIIGALFAGALYASNPLLPFLFGFLAFAFATICAYIYNKRCSKSN